MSGPLRATILYGPFDGWDMPPYQQIDGATWIHGGVRSLLEAAAGLAGIGLDVELRGGFVELEVSAIEHAADVQLGRPSARRPLEPDELVIIPEGGHDDPLIFARAALSGARAVLMMLGPLGLVGWSFDETPVPQVDEILTIDPVTVGRTESLAAARSFGLELWTNTSAIAARGASAGIDVKYVGVGRPAPYPEPGAKSVDVLALGDNRWRPLATEAIEAMPARFSTRIQPRGSHAELLASFSAARVFMHPARIEGRSRLCEEARAMRAVPVLLASNTNGEGYGPEYGSVVVESVDEMAAAAIALLNDPDRLATLAETGYRTARQVGDWEAYKRRLLEVVARPDAMVAAGAYARSQVGRRVADERAHLLRRLGALEHERNGLKEERDGLKRERDCLERERDGRAAEAAALRERTVALWVQLDEASHRVQELNEGLLGLLSSSSWKVTKPLRAAMAVVRAVTRIGRACTMPHRTK